jgi:hypothetical protein
MFRELRISKVLSRKELFENIFMNFCEFAPRGLSQSNTQEGSVGQIFHRQTLELIFLFVSETEKSFLTLTTGPDLWANFFPAPTRPSPTSTSWTISWHYLHSPTQRLFSKIATHRPD